ncbi:MAG: HAD family hydrolase [Anaerolineales bacterium]
MILPARVHTLLFDFDGTLCHRRPSSLDVFFDLLEDTEVKTDPQAKRMTRRFVHYYWANSPEFLEDFETFGELTSAFWERYLKRKLVALGLDEGRAGELSSQLQPGMEEKYQPVPWVPPDVHPTLAALRLEGYALGLVSNRSMPMDEELDELELAQYFNFQLTAGEIKSWKPDREIFEYALDLAQSTPGETSYIGDNYFTDILGAQKTGLHTILVDPHGTFPDADCPVISSIGELMDNVD